MKAGRLLGVFLITFLLSYGDGKAQASGMAFQLEIGPGQNLKDAIDQLAKAYRIDFAYAPDVLAQKQLAPAKFSAPDIEALLQQLLAKKSVQYHIVSENRILLRSFDLLENKAGDGYTTINGRIVDDASGLPMTNVAVALDTLNLGTLSDEEGRFSLQLPEALRRRTVLIYHIGYKTKRLSLTELMAGKAVRLSAEPLALREIVVVEQIPSLSNSLRDGSVSLRGDGIDGANASVLAGNDVFRRVQLLAGVSANDDLSSDIKIRGSNADETLIILDGMPLYKVEHFYSVFSALNSSYLEEVKLYKNALPIQYGGRTGGMLLLRSADAINGLSGQADLNLLSAALKVDLPLSSRVGISLSGRRSHTNLADSKLFNWVDSRVDNYVDNEFPNARPDVLTTNPDFSFSDWNGKILIRPNDRHRLAFNYYYSTDDYLNAYYNRFGNNFNLERVVFEEDFRDKQDWKNIGSSLQYRAAFSNNWTLDLEGFFTQYRFEESLDVRVDRTSPSMGTRTSVLENDQYNRVENAGSRLLLTKKMTADRELQIGSSWNLYRTDFTITSEVDTLLGSSGKAFDIQWFANYLWRPVKQLELSLGGRMNYYKLTDRFYFSPRLSANYRLDDGLALKGSYSINYQFIRELTHENRLGQSVSLVALSDGRRFPVGESRNFMLGANYCIDNWGFDLEFYHKKLESVLEHSSLLPGFGNEPVRPGTRQNYFIFVGDGTVNGMDVTVGWDYPFYSGHLAYTLSKSTNRFPQIQRGAPIPARDDRRHQLKWINTWSLGRFDLSANFLYTSGRPYYDQRMIQGERRRELVRWLPSYQRLDLGVDYRFDIGKTSAQLGVSVFNLTDNPNVKYLQFIYSTNTEESSRALNRVIGSQTDLLDRTLNIRFGLEF